MVVFKLRILIGFTFLTTLLRGQNLDRANELFKNGGYAEAIPIYEAFLAKKSNNIAAKTKLANCYRILSRPEKAAPLMADIVEEDNARPDDFLHYAETLMMLGQYDEAKFYFKKYNKLQPENERGKLLLDNVDKVKKLKPIFKDVEVYSFSQNSDGDDNAPTLHRKGIAFASDRHPGFSILKEKNPTTGRDYVTVYYAERTGDTSFAQPRELSGKLTEINRNTSNISFTADGKRAYFCRNGSKPGRNGTYNMQIFTAEVSDGNSFHNIEMLPFCSAENNYVYPSISPDGKRLFYTAERSDGYGGLDIYMVTKTKKGWTKSENLGNKVNTAANEGFPYAAPDGKLYFCSKGHPSYGGYDIFVTQPDSTATNEWQAPINVGSPINSPYDDISICFDTSGLNGAFTSMRSGRGDDIFLFKIISEPILDNKVIAVHKDTSETQKEVILANESPKISFEKPETVNNNSEMMADTNNKNTSFTPNRKEKKENTSKRTSKTKNTKNTDSEKDEDEGKKTYLDAMQKLLDNDKMRLNKSFLAENIRYKTQAELGITPDMALELDDLVAFLKKNRKLMVEICVHTEGGIETDKLAKSISTQRAEEIVAYLKSQGIKEKRLLAHGYGRIRPLKDCATGGCKPEEDLLNRRVEVKIKKL
jgi:outer membrane protein OmpA-like peptidoglycan-associated protein